MSGWIDISVPVRNGMVHWPGDPQFCIERVMDQEHGHDYTVSRMSLGVHTGTHMDAPMHSIPGGLAIEEMPLDACVGPARVIRIDDAESVKRAELIPYKIGAGERVLFRTANSGQSWATDAFDEDFVYISHDAAAYLVECGVRAVGVDYLSVGGFRCDGRETHDALLGAGIWIVEGLNLSNVEPGDYELICLPLKLVGADGAPARAILRSAS